MGPGLIPSFAEAKKMIPVSRSFSPNSENKPVYDRNYAVFKKLYLYIRLSFALFNSGK